VKQANSRQVRFFVSYSHDNKTWFGRLRPILSFRTPTNIAHIWHDQELKAGDQWDKEIRRELKDMDVFVCLLSYEFLASNYIMGVEVPLAVDRQKKDKIEIIPILLYPVDLKRECKQLHKFNPLPAWGKCWRDYEQGGGHYQDAHKPIREGLWQAIEKILSHRKRWSH
jgi:hypothetical protein